MKIVKSFISPNIKNPPIKITGPLREFRWEWGLDEDGNLYARSSYFPFDAAHGGGDDNWKLADMCFLFPSLKEMKIIIKEFGHLVVFI